MNRRLLLNRGWQVLGGVAASSLIPWPTGRQPVPREPKETWLSMERPLVGDHQFFLVPAFEWPYFQVQFGRKPWLPGDGPRTGPLHQRTRCWFGDWRVERLGWHPDRLELTMHRFDPERGERRVISLPGPLHVSLVHQPPYEIGYDYLEFQHPAEGSWAGSGDCLTSPADRPWVESLVAGRVFPGDYMPQAWRERGQFCEAIDG